MESLDLIVDAVLKGRPYSAVADAPLPNIVLDVETTIRSPLGFQADPFYPDNEIVMAGYGIIGQKNIHIRDASVVDDLNLIPAYRLIGHNIKFDIHYLRKHGLEMRSMHHCIDTKAFMRIMHPELSNYSLDSCCEYYGWEVKDNRIKEYWDKGVDTPDIPTDLLEEYQRHDVIVTTKLFKQLLKEMGELPQELSVKVLRRLNMKGFLTLALQEMEWNGIPMDMMALRDMTTEQEEELARADDEYHDMLGFLFTPEDLKDMLASPTVKIWSPRSLSTILFHIGGIKVRTVEEDGIYKNGNRKTKTVTRLVYPINKLCEVDPDATISPSTGAPTNKAALAAISTSDPVVVALLQVIGKYRASKKLLSTYLHPFFEMAQNYREPVLHPTYNTDVAATERLSSSNPNGQNLPTILAPIFCGTLPDTSPVIKGDFSQLEVCALAHVSQDPQLLKDIRSGTDIHKGTGETLGKFNMSEQERRTIKGVNFGTIYDGKPTTISAQTGVPKNEVKKIQKAFFSRYRTLRSYFDGFKQQLTDELTVPKNYEVIDGQIQRTYLWRNDLGHGFLFKEERVPDYITERTGQVLGINPNKVANYPIQGIATGDWVLAYVAMLLVDQRWYDHEKVYDHYKLNSTVHDDVKYYGNLSATKESNLLLAERMKEVGEKGIPAWHESISGNELSVPLKMDVEIKTHW